MSELYEEFRFSTVTDEVMLHIKEIILAVDKIKTARDRIQPMPLEDYYSITGDSEMVFEAVREWIVKAVDHLECIIKIKEMNACGYIFTVMFDNMTVIIETDIIMQEVENKEELWQAGQFVLDNKELYFCDCVIERKKRNKACTDNEAIFVMHANTDAAWQEEIDKKLKLMTTFLHNG